MRKLPLLPRPPALVRGGLRLSARRPRPLLRRRRWDRALLAMEAGAAERRVGERRVAVGGEAPQPRAHSARGEACGEKK